MTGAKGSNRIILISLEDFEIDNVFMVGVALPKVLVVQYANNQVISGNLHKYASANRSLLQCKTLPAHFSNNVMVYEWRLCLQKSLEQYSECL